MILKPTFQLLIAVMSLSLSGCSFVSPETADAKVLCKSLKSAINTTSTTAAREQEVLNSVVQWAGQVVSMGFMAFQPIAPNAKFPQGYQQQLDQVRDVWRVARQQVTVASHPKSAEVQVFQSDVLDPWQRREQALTEISELLIQCTQQIQRETAVAGFMFGQVSTHPTVINTVYDKVRAYQPPPDKAASTLSALRIKYKLTDADLQ